MIYDEHLLTNDLKSYLNQNGGFLKKKSPNLPMKLKVHIYIIKASILNPIHLDSKFDPFILIEYGNEKLAEEKIKNDSIEPLIGKFFSFEAKFPSESQLFISIKNWNLLDGTELIGKTLIDLEERFYSDCYATCGLPKRFETSGYNEWRDVLTPKQILTKFCKKFNLMSPRYINEKLLLFHVNGDLVYEGSIKPDLVSEKESVNEKDSSINKMTNDPEETEDSEQEEKRLIETNKIKEKKYNEIEEQLALDALNSWESITKVTII